MSFFVGKIVAFVRLFYNKLRQSCKRIIQNKIQTFPFVPINVYEMLNFVEKIGQRLLLVLLRCDSFHGKFVCDIL